MAEKYPAIYMMANGRNGTLYIGVTSNLIKRTYEHKHHLADGFTKKHKCSMLVYYELCDSMDVAVHREKRLKKYTRKAKLNLIENQNPDWKDLYETVIP
ncbi:MAG: GIY-YIG nuclease family protein [Rickettsiales bacterium]